MFPFDLRTLTNKQIIIKINRSTSRALSPASPSPRNESEIIWFSEIENGIIEGNAWNIKSHTNLMGYTRKKNSKDHYHLLEQLIKPPSYYFLLAEHGRDGGDHDEEWNEEAPHRNPSN